MLELLVAVGIVAFTALHVREVAERHGRDPVGWMCVTGAVAVAGWVLGFLVSVACLMGAPDSPLSFGVSLLAPGALALVFMAAVVAAVHWLPLEVAQLEASAWPMRRLDGGGGACALSLHAAELRMEGAPPVRIPLACLTRCEADGEALALAWDEGGDARRALLIPTELPSRETRVHFCRVLSERIRRARTAAPAHEPQPAP